MKQKQVCKAEKVYKESGLLYRERLLSERRFFSNTLWLNKWVTVRLGKIKESRLISRKGISEWKQLFFRRLEGMIKIAEMTGNEKRGKLIGKEWVKERSKFVFQKYTKKLYGACTCVAQFSLLIFLLGLLLFLFYKRTWSRFWYLYFFSKASFFPLSVYHSKYPSNYLSLRLALSLSIHISFYLSIPLSSSRKSQFVRCLFA